MIRNPARHRDRSPRPPKKPVAPLPQLVAPQKNRSDRSIAEIGRSGLFCCSFPTGISRGRSDETEGSDRSFPKSIGPADHTDRSGRPPPPHRSKVASFLRLPLRKIICRTDRSCMLAGPVTLPRQIIWDPCTIVCADPLPLFESKSTSHSFY